MMKRGNSFGVCVILILLALGYYIPSGILAIEDLNRNQEQKVIAIDAIQLNSTNVEVSEQLREFANMMFEQIVIEMDKEQMSDAESEVQNDKNNIQNCVNEFWKKFLNKEAFDYEKFTCGNYVLMAGVSSEKVYSIWEYIGIDKDGKEYCFWIDDVSGKVLAFEIPFSSIGNKESDYYYAMYQLSLYYGFPSYSFTENISNFYKLKSWENGFILYDEGKQEKVAINVHKVGDRMYFNIYPGTKKIFTLQN